MIYNLKLSAQQITGVAQLLTQARDTAAQVAQQADATLASINTQCREQTEAAQAAEAAAAEELARENAEVRERELAEANELSDRLDAARVDAARVDQELKRDLAALVPLAEAAAEEAAANAALPVLTDVVKPGED